MRNAECVMRNEKIPEVGASDMLPSWKTEKEKTVDMKGALVYAKEQI